MDLLILSLIVISILAGLMLGLYWLVLKEYCLNKTLEAAQDISESDDEVLSS
jgi:capsular polysaccharide biosynthesis protein